MVEFARKSLLTAIAGASALGFAHAGIAHAAVLRYGFEITVNQGSYAGVHQGSFQFDNSKLAPCATNPSFLCATPSSEKGSLLVTFNFMGQPYTQTDDIDYNNPISQFPAVYYEPSRVSLGLTPYILSFLAMPSQPQMNFFVLEDLFYAGFASLADAASEANRVGTVRYYQITTPPSPPPAPPAPPEPPIIPAPLPCDSSPDTCHSTAVPEPSEIAGTAIALGVFGVFWQSRRKKVRSSIDFSSKKKN